VLTALRDDNDDPTVKDNPLTARHFYALAGVTVAVSLLKGLRLPSLWAATQMTFNYSQGFVRRGLVGELLWLVSGGRLFRYGVVLLISLLLLGALVFQACRMIGRAVRLDDGDVGLKAAILVVVATPGVVFWAHMIGYLDYVGALFMASFILWSARSPRPYAIFYVGAAGVVGLGLVHESMVIMFLPAALFVMTCHTIVRTRESAGAPPTRRSLIAHLAVSAVVALIAAMSISRLGTRSVVLVDALRASIASRANFNLRPDAFEPLSQPVSENLLHVMPAMFRFHPHHAMQVVHGLIVSGVGFIAIGNYAIRLIDRIGLTYRERTIVIASFIVAMLAPLSLNFVGWDSARWNAICVFNAFSCVIALKLFFTARAAEPSAQGINGPGGLTLSAVAVVLGLVSNYDLFLFEGRVVQWFPFDEQVKAFVSLVGHGFQVIPDR